MAAMGNGPVTVTKFDRGKRDELAEWSRSRSKGLAKMTASLKNNTVRDSLFSGYNGGHWGFYNSFGLWVYNPFSFTYCFLPFGRGWYSPYGWGYGMGLYWYDFRPYYRDPQYNPVPLPPTPQGELGKRKPVEDLAPPPFTQLQRQQYGDLSRRDYNNTNNGGGGGGGFYDSGRRDSSGDRVYNSGDSNRSSGSGMSAPVRSSPDLPPPPSKRDKPIDY
jgi:hypothetical protein